MTPRPCLLWPDKRLRAVARPVETVNDEIRDLWSEMTLIMEAMPGVGLAAPQIGVGLRIAIVDASKERGQVIRMANPEILHASVRLIEHEEASPNLPGVSAVIKRPRAVTLRYMDETGATIERDLVGLWAISAQHQIDHLNGRLYVDHLSKTRRDMLIRRSLKLR